MSASRSHTEVLVLDPAVQQPSLNVTRRVLIIDDDPVFAALASETLTQAGYATVIAGNAEEALAAFRRDQPDLVLLDVNLPDANGFQICSSLRSIAERNDVPIVMVTGQDDTRSIAQAYEVGATDFIQKPVLWPTLPHRVSFMLRAVDNLRALKVSEQKNRALVEALPDAIFVVDRNGIVSEHIAGVDRASGERLLGRTLEQAFPPDLALAARAALTERVTNEIATYEFSVGKGTERRWMEARLRPQGGGPLLIVLRDTTERRRAKARIEYLAYYDVLTKLPNRQLFVRETARAIELAKQSNTQIALLYVDLDRFKRINDNLGHSVGDTLLQNVARRLEHGVRQADVVLPASGVGKQELARVARLGGDEFVVLLTGVTAEAQVANAAERIQKLLGEPIDCGGHRFVITPSIGIAMFPSDATNIDDLLAKADMAMYQAKEGGRNGYVFFGQSMAVRSLSRLELESDLRRAMDRGEFLLHYQPKCDLLSGDMVGVEALLRWPHPERGWIPPDTFIPVAEETGIIIQLGDWVITQACQQLRRWADEGLGHLSIAVNVSVQQFSRDNFLESVQRILAQTGVDPRRLELEITESLLMKDVAETTACLKRFRQAGIALSIDDFGTGYSSLGYLRRFPIDALKIDRSFVKDLEKNDDAAAICAAIIALARELKLKVIAEGVETQQQIEFLRQHRCDLAQGYLISKPVCIDDLQRRLRHVTGSDGSKRRTALAGSGMEL